MVSCDYEFSKANMQMERSQIRVSIELNKKRSINDSTRHSTMKLTSEKSPGRGVAIKAPKDSVQQPPASVTPQQKHLSQH